MAPSHPSEGRPSRRPQSARSTVQPACVWAELNAAFTATDWSAVICVRWCPCFVFLWEAEARSEGGEAFSFLKSQQLSDSSHETISACLSLNTKYSWGRRECLCKPQIACPCFWTINTLHSASCHACKNTQRHVISVEQLMWPYSEERVEPSKC